MESWKGHGEEMTRTSDHKHGKNKQAEQDARLQSGEPEEQDRDRTSENDLREYDYQAMDVESFVPTDFYPSTNVRGRHNHSRKKRRALWAVLIVVGVLLLAAGSVFAYVMFLDPSTQFVNASDTPNPVEVVAVDEEDATPTPDNATPTPTLDPYEVISAQADTSMMQNIVNVLLIGVDYAEERETWNGKHEYHADVMMVMAINFDENRVDLISLPRDTYAKIPGVKGIYKLNASINCGGGFEAEGGAGFLKTCEAASWMLGGIPVNYYYAVTMPAVKQLVDAVGGVDYDLELSYKMMGRSYSAGPNHLNGQGVLDYLRVRKNISSGGDLNRVNRQKKMLIALFESMQEQNLILKIPDIIGSFEGQLFTNCTLGQTAALTKFAYSLDKDNIGMYSIGGTITNIFNWNFCLTDQSNRVKVIKQVYGIDVPKELEYTSDYAHYRWADMVATQYLKTVAPLTEFVSAALAEDDLLPTMEPTPDATAEVTPEYVAPLTPVPATTPTPTDSPTPSPTATTESGTASRATNSFAVVRLSAANPVLGETYRRYSEYSRQLFNDYLMSLDALEEAQAVARKEASKYAAGKTNDLKQAQQDVSDYASHVKTNALSLAQEFGYSTSKFVWTYRYEYDSSFNEVKVDFN
ncbi:MAG: LCP family protein [Clostridiales bacterium]|nr:LCP family protein [Clostridiales bacterium]